MPITAEDMTMFRAELVRNRSLIDSLKALIHGMAGQVTAAAGPDLSDDLKALLAEWKSRDDELAAATVANTGVAAAGAGPGALAVEPQVGDPLPHNELSGGNPVGQQDGTAVAPAGQPAPPGSDDPALIGAGTAGGEAAAVEATHGAAGPGGPDRADAGTGRVQADQFSFTGSISGDVLTITSAAPHPTLQPGMTLEGDLIAPGTSITAANPDGTYTVSPAGQSTGAIIARPLAGA